MLANYPRHGRAYRLVPPSTPASCPATCYGATCEHWVGQGYSCASIVAGYSHACDCRGCASCECSGVVDGGSNYPRYPTQCGGTGFNFQFSVDLPSGTTRRAASPWETTTENGHTCDTWNGRYGFSGHSYCRKAGEAKAWCYTTDPNVNWDWCDGGGDVEACVTGNCANTYRLADLSSGRWDSTAWLGDSSDYPGYLQVSKNRADAMPLRLEAAGGGKYYLAAPGGRYVGSSGGWLYLVASAEKAAFDVKEGAGYP